jgi:hypothetical protein
MATREIVSELTSTGLLTAALWLSSTEGHQDFAEARSASSPPHYAFASAADVLRDSGNNPDITRQ